MIDQELKIKIVDYADGVLDESLKAEVEEILQSNGEANEFLNQLKSVEIELNSKFNTNEYHNFSRSVDHKIDDLLETKLEASKKNSFFGMLSNSFGVRSMVGTNIVTAAVFLFIGTLYFNVEDPGLSEFTDTSLNKNILIFRSSDDEKSVNSQLEKIISDLIENKVLAAKGKLGEESYQLKLIKINTLSDQNKCYTFKFLRDSIPNEDISVCKNSSKLTFLKNS